MRHIAFFFSIAILIVLSSCDSSDGGGIIDVDRGPLLENMANNLIISSFEDLTTELDDLETSVNTFTADVSQANLDALQDQFEDAYLSFESTSPYRFGPSLTYGLNAQLNSFPTETSEINSNISAGTWNLQAIANADAKGLPAIDYLLFHDADATILADFSTDDNADNRKQYLKDVVADMKSTISSILTEWKGDYKTEFLAQTGTDAGGSITLLVNEMIFDFEEMRRYKVDYPAGTSFGDIEVYPELAEGYYSSLSLKLMAQQMVEIENIFLGVGAIDGEGLYEYLVKLNEEELANQISTEINTIQTAIANLPEPYTVALEDHPAKISHLQESIQALVTSFKTDMLLVTGIPRTKIDTDGD